MELIVTFSLFYLFDPKLVDLMFFFFVTRQNVRARKIGRVSKVLRARARSNAQFASHNLSSPELPVKYIFYGYQKAVGWRKLLGAMLILELVRKIDV